MWASSAKRSAKLPLLAMAASAAPPRIVKSPPLNATLRPFTNTVPATELAGFSLATWSPSHVAVPAMAPISWNVPGSSSSATRSRTVNRPRE